MQVDRRIPPPPPQPDPPAEYHLVLSPREIRILQHGLHELIAAKQEQRAGMPGYPRPDRVEEIAHQLWFGIEDAIWLAEDGWDADQ